MKKISVFLLTLVAGLSLVACGKKTTKQATTKKTDPAPTPTPTSKTYKSKSLEEVAEALDGKVVLEVKLPDENSDAWQYMDATLAICETQTSSQMYIASPEGAYYFTDYPGKEGMLYMYLLYGTDVFNVVYGVDSTVVGTFIDLEESLSIACGLDITYTSKETNVNFINRTCTKYTNTTTEGSATITESWIIDDTIGICLKHTIQSSATTDPTIDETTFVVTKFLVGNAVDTYLETVEDKVVVTPWDATFMHAHGFDRGAEDPFYYSLEQLYENYSGTKPTYYYAYAVAQLNDEDDIYDLETAVILESDDDNAAKVKGDFAARVLLDLYQAGAKYDDDGQETTLDNLATYTTDPDDDSIITAITFTAYTDATSPFGNTKVTFTYVLEHPRDLDTVMDLQIEVNNLKPTASLQA